MSPGGLMTVAPARRTLDPARLRAGTTNGCSPTRSRAPLNRHELERVMAGRVLSRFAAVGVVAGVLLGGAWVHGAVAKDEPKYSQSDCDTITNIQVKGSANGYYGKTALNASKAYATAAQDIEDDELKAAMLTLSKTWAKAS